MSRDNGGLPFIIVDKVNARLFLFDGGGALRASSSVLLGVAHGDVSPPGIGDRKLSSMTAAERVTPAGRFMASRGHDLSGKDIVWVDYGAAIALHRATDSMPGLTARGRLARLASASAADKRITHGCINVSPDFFDRFIGSTFSVSDGIVYVMPETRSLRDVFPMAAPVEHVQAQPRSETAAQPKA